MCVLSPPMVAAVRYVGIDLHRHWIVVAAVDRDQQLVLPPRRLHVDAFPAWAQQHLRQTDIVAFEASTNAWYWHDHLAPLVSRVVVTHAADVRAIASARVKTDRRDSVQLARLLAADLLPEVWVPPSDVRDLRTLLGHRRDLISQRIRLRNYLQSLLAAYQLTPPAGDPFSRANRPWWDTLTLADADQLRVRQHLALLTQLEPLVAEVDARLAQLSTSERWQEQATYLVQLPGVGLVTAMTLLAAIGEISRFPTAKKLVGYSGLGAGIHASGETSRGRGITKHGRQELRVALVEAAWVAVRDDSFWARTYAHLQRRVGKPKAIVAIARKLLVVVWHVLTELAADRHAEVERVARKLFGWAQRVGSAGRGGERRAVFVRRALDLLRLGQDLDRLHYCGEDYALPPSALTATGP
jgi:transposase